MCRSNFALLVVIILLVNSDANGPIFGGSLVGLKSESEYSDTLNQFFGPFMQLCKEVNNVPLEKDVTFWCANRKQPKFQQVFANSKSIFAHLRPNKPTAFFIHGWLINWLDNIPMMRRYLDAQDANVCGVDWESLAKCEYKVTVNNARDKVGPYLAAFISNLIAINVKPENVTIIGHSIGAHIAGITGSLIKRGRLGYIIGLDPAGPLYTAPILHSLSEILDENDAIFVQTMVTNKNHIGTNFSLGHQNFFPNGGLQQSGCKIVDSLLGFVKLRKSKKSYSQTT